MSNMITGTSAASTAVPTVAPVTSADSFLTTANELLVGARVLAGNPDCAVTLVYVCAHVTECLFKAFLSRMGETDAELQRTGHDLASLRGKAVAHGLGLDPPLPDWLRVLGELHAKPYRLLYPKNLNGFVLPGPQPMLADLETLDRLVRAVGS
jgi:hypothetical protein